MSSNSSSPTSIVSSSSSDEGASSADADVGWNDDGREICSKANPGEIKQDTNASSVTFNTYFICDTSIGDWRTATTPEYDTYRWGAGDDGAIRKGAVTDARYKYDELQGLWKSADRLDTALGLNGCTRKRETEIKRGNDGDDYVCASGQWREANLWNVPKEARFNPDVPYDTMTDVRDGRTYRTVVIGSQTWMAENLNYMYMVDGSVYGNWCYNDSARYCSVTGRLYTWAAAMDTAATGCGLGGECAADTGRVQGVCPDGWHLPSPAEWDTLFAAAGVGGQSIAGTALRTASGWDVDENGAAIVGTDTVGFSALPSGSRNIGAHSFGAGVEAYFWSSSENDASDACDMYLYYGEAFAIRTCNQKNNAFAVRCVRN